MTKRFEYTAYDDGTESIYDKKEDEYYYDMQLSNIEELLNDLFDENEHLIRKRGELETRNIILEGENEELKQYKQVVNDVLDSYYQKDLSPIEEILVGGIARELNLDLHYKPKKGDVE